MTDSSHCAFWEVKAASDKHVPIVPIRLCSWEDFKAGMGGKDFDSPHNSGAAQNERFICAPSIVALDRSAAYAAGSLDAVECAAAIKDILARKGLFVKHPKLLAAAAGGSGGHGGGEGEVEALRAELAALKAAPAPAPAATLGEVEALRAELAALKAAPAPAPAAALSSSERAVKDDEAAAGAAAPGRPQGGVARWRRWRGLHRSRRAATASGLASRGRGGVGSAVWWRAQRAGGRSGGESGHLPPRHHRARDRGAPKRCFIFFDKNFPSPSPIKFNRKRASLRPQTKSNSTANQQAFGRKPN